MGRYGWPGTVICIAPFPSTYLASTFLTSRQPRNLPQPPPPIMPSLPHLEQPRICHPITGCSDALGEGRIIFMTPRYACSNARAAVSNKQEKNWRSRKFCYAAIVSSREIGRADERREGNGGGGQCINRGAPV